MAQQGFRIIGYHGIVADDTNWLSLKLVKCMYASFVVIGAKLPILVQLVNILYTVDRFVSFLLYVVDTLADRLIQQIKVLPL